MRFALILLALPFCSQAQESAEAILQKSKAFYTSRKQDAVRFKRLYTEDIYGKTDVWEGDVYYQEGKQTIAFQPGVRKDILIYSTPDSTFWVKTASDSIQSINMGLRGRYIGMPDLFKEEVLNAWIPSYSTPNTAVTKTPDGLIQLRKEGSDGFGYLNIDPKTYRIVKRYSEQTTKFGKLISDDTYTQLEYPDSLNNLAESFAYWQKQLTARAHSGFPTEKQRKAFDKALKEQGVNRTALQEELRRTNAGDIPADNYILISVLYPGCKTCYDDLKELQKKAEGNKLSIVAMEPESPDPKRGQEIVNIYDLEMPFFFGQEAKGIKQAVFSDLQVLTLPQYLLINSRGEIVENWSYLDDHSIKKIARKTKR